MTKCDFIIYKKKYKKTLHIYLCDVCVGILRTKDV